MNCILESGEQGSVYSDPGSPERGGHWIRSGSSIFGECGRLDRSVLEIGLRRL